MQVVHLIVEAGRVHGLLALDLDRLGEEDHGLTLFLTPFVVLCTGGPALVYERTVYPPSQTGCTGAALLAGAQGCNLNHWQYGIASTAFRWNLSGSYQQVLPRYVSAVSYTHLDVYKRQAVMTAPVRMKNGTFPFP